MHAIVLRCGTQLERPKGARDEVESEKEYDKVVAPSPNENEPHVKSESEKQKELKTLPPKPYMSRFPFPQRFAKAKLDS